MTIIADVHKLVMFEAMNHSSVRYIDGEARAVIFCAGCEAEIGQMPFLAWSGGLTLHVDCVLAWADKAKENDRAFCGPGLLEDYAVAKGLERPVVHELLSKLVGLTWHMEEELA